MRNAIVICAVCAVFPSSALANGGVPSVKVGETKEVCKPCVAKKRVVKKRTVRRVKVRTVQPVNFELQCYRRGGEWRNGLCYAKREPAPAIVPPANSVNVRSEQNVVVKNTMLSQAAQVAPPKIKKAKKVAKQNSQWWWIGPGVFVLGTWAGEKDFIVGASGKLVFAINNRFRVAGLVGAGLGPWQESKPNILVGVEGSVRLWNWFFLSAGLETVWGGFQGLSVHRRILFAAIGPEFWIGERASISLHFLFGTRDDVTSCSTDLGKFTAGNLLQATLYF